MRYLANAVNVLQAANQLIFKHLNPLNRESTVTTVITNPKMISALFLYYVGARGAAAKEVTEGILECFHVNDVGDPNHLAALYENTDQGPALKTDALIKTGCVTPLNGITPCEGLSYSTTLNFCAVDACQGNEEGGCCDSDSPKFHYSLKTNETFLIFCLKQAGFPPGSDKAVCSLENCPPDTLLQVIATVSGVTVGGVALMGSVYFTCTPAGREKLSTCWARLTGRDAGQPLLQEVTQQTEEKTTDVELQRQHQR